MLILRIPVRIITHKMTPYRSVGSGLRQVFSSLDGWGLGLSLMMSRIIAGPAGSESEIVLE